MTLVEKDLRRVVSVTGGVEMRAFDLEQRGEVPATLLATHCVDEGHQTESDMPLALAACLVLAMLLAMSGFPGVLEANACLWIPVYGFGGIISLVYWVISLEPGQAIGLQSNSTVEVAGRHSLWRHRKTIIGLTILCELGMLKGHIPMRIGFALSRPSFERLLVSAPAPGFLGITLGSWLGVYHVDRVATDPRGGVYFRSNTGPDGLGPDTVSYGFAYRPNDAGSPFGNCRYASSRVLGDWYLFNASNDY